MAHMMLEAKRATRGKRMNALVGQAADDDDTFWGHDVWQEGGGSDEESFHTQDEDDKPDEFDSDFNDSESEDEEDEDEEEEKAAQRGGKVQSKVANRYKDPALLKKNKAKGIKNPFASSENDNDAAMDVDEADDEQEETASQKELRKEQQKAAAKERKRVTYDILPRSVRESTKSKTQSADIARSKKDDEDRKKKRINIPKPTKCQFNYQDLLQEALQTEDENRKWLEMRKFWLQHKEEQEKKLNNPLDTVVKDYVRYYSRRNVGTYVTFSSQDAVPKCLREESNHPPPPPPSNICVITGLPAKYRDPKTLLPYANPAALRELRRRHDNGRLPAKSPHVANSTNSNTLHGFGCAQKTVRVVVQPKEEKLDANNCMDITQSAESIEVNPSNILSLPRSLSHNSLRTGGNLSQQATPRLGSSSNFSPSNPTLPLTAPTSPHTPKGYLRSQQLNLEDSLEKAEDEAEMAEVMKLGKPRRQGNNFIYIAPSINDASLSTFQSMLPPGLTVDSSHNRIQNNDNLSNDEDFSDEMFLGKEIAAIVEANKARMRKEGEALVLCIHRA